MQTAIWWLRRDLRINDNQALNAALTHAGRVIPVYILDPRLIQSAYVGEKRLAFLYEGLRRLDADLRQRGSHLIVRQGSPVSELTLIKQVTQAGAVYAESDYSPYARQRDAMVARHLPLHLTGGVTVHPPEFIHKPNGEPYTVYTPFSKTWKALYAPGNLQVRPAPESMPLSGEDIPGSQALPDTPVLSPSVPFLPGEAEAQRRLNAFLSENIYQYAEKRNLPGAAGTSLLSPYLRYGMISARQAVAAAYQAIESAPYPAARKGAETWLNELIWREFYIAVLYHYPHVRARSFREDLQHISWENDPRLFDAWKQGLSGYPIVDAAMRQLTSSGWMHNRTRMIAASFLVKHLLIDWRWGERWFMQHLVDGDPAANNGGWQWSAGTGTDAAPYFRVFNPILQGARFDPGGDYVRCWVPELGNVPDEFIHKPWEMPAALQRQAGCVIGEHYPKPIVEHSWARQRALDVFKQARERFALSGG
jgi:deoxyribodipyrimidine photo-lyase